ARHPSAQQPSNAPNAAVSILHCAKAGVIDQLPERCSSAIQFMPWSRAHARYGKAPAAASRTADCTAANSLSRPAWVTAACWARRADPSAQPTSPGVVAILANSQVLWVVSVAFLLSTSHAAMGRSHGAHSDVASLIAASQAPPDMVPAARPRFAAASATSS